MRYLPEKLIAIVNDIYGTEYTKEQFIRYSVEPIRGNRLRREDVYYIPHLRFFILIKRSK